MPRVNTSVALVRVMVDAALILRELIVREPVPMMTLAPTLMLSVVLVAALSNVAIYAGYPVEPSAPTPA